MMSEASPEEILFDAARQAATAEERKACLDQHCAGDPALRSRVEGLLAALDGAEEFFTQSLTALPPLVNDASLSLDREGVAVSYIEEKAGACIGRYQVIEKIGEGGGGVVYMADQLHPVRRRVALKVIKLGMDTQSVIARFEAERQALAMMDHPNIAKVLDAGATGSGRPYFVMELVRGFKITDYCDQHQLSIPERLHLVIQVCQAIQHAHQKGVIHRDIKPSNILITPHDGVPVPKVIDFGIAKATETVLTDKPPRTANWQVLGTPAYMSPEQAEMRGLDIDTRSDVYSLGALLYELLTGTTPLDTDQLLKSGIVEMRQILRQTEPLRPSRKLETLPAAGLAATAGLRRTEPAKLLSQVRGDLDWVVMKALEKDRARRYETANGLARDIQRHIDHQPVAARPPTTIYQFQKLVRRNKAMVAAVGAVAIALLIGLGVSSWLYVLEKQARQRAVVAEKLQVELRKEAEAGRAGEALLRQQAEVREKLTQAVILLRDQNHAAADRLVRDLSVIQPTLEGAATFRTLGEWHAHEGRWKEATERFSSLLQVNQLEWQDLPSLDYVRASAAWIELADESGYDVYRKAMIARYAKSQDPISAERTIKCCLIVPGDEALMASLAPLGRVSIDSFEGKSEYSVPQSEAEIMVWRMLSIALMQYRLGQYEVAAAWTRRSLAYPAKVPNRKALAHILLAMSLQQLQPGEQARAELEAGRAILNERFDRVAREGWNHDTHWFDWVIARGHIREADALFSLNQEKVTAE